MGYLQGLDIPKDAVGGFAVTADVLHNVVHEGYMFELGAAIVDASFDTGVNFDVVLTTGEKEVHLVYDLDIAGGRAELVVSKNAVFTAATGTALTAYNKKHSSTNTLLTTARVGATVTNAGTQCEPTQHVFSTATGQTKFSSQKRQGVEINLQPNTVYLFRLTARADNMLAFLDISLYERKVLV